MLHIYIYRDIDMYIDIHIPICIQRKIDGMYVLVQKHTVKYIRYRKALTRTRTRIWWD